MGVPAFFRWLSKKYPSIVVHCDDGVKGQYHFDNLYLDMNGIIHPCSHPENKAAPETEEEMFLAIFEYVEDIMKIVKPKKLLYMAVDGVAPRAKMNQQRSRRFRAAQESYDKLIEIQKVKDDLRERGIEVKEKSKEAHFDSNVITPGTQFMINLSEALRTWIDKKLDVDYQDKHDIWPKDLVIILSDASVPGEGEHKIMDYIRKQKSDTCYDPNLSHCLYGADADLIMLGLATHEPHFTILREEFKPNQPKPCDLCGQIGHDLKDCTGVERPPEELPVPLDTEFIYIRLNVLREYLEKESQKCAVKLDFERFIDDYVFLCFFVGNDFLPHLPSLEIRENAIDRLILIYKHVMETVPDHNEMYLTKSGIVNKDRVQHILQELGEVEDEIFRQRQQSDLNFKERNKRRKLMRMNEELRWMSPQAVQNNSKPATFNNAKEEASKVRTTFHNSNDRLNSMLIDKNSSNASNKRKLEEDEDSEPEDNVQLFNDGYKERYYLQKFDCNSLTEIGKMVSEEYFKGLCWVLLYYYQGCPDWKWFFPYHYAPFASDFHNVAQIEVNFDSTAKPFRPLEQLMSVFPAASSKNLPTTWRNLMTNLKSPIIDFYPTTFRIDLNGKKAAWMGVALLPFIDEERLFKALDDVYGDLNQNEIDRNRLGSHLIFVSKKHNFLSPLVKDVIESNKMEESIPLGDNTVKLISGTLSKSLLYSNEYSNLYCCEYKDPQYESGFIFPAVLLKSAKIPDPVLRPGQISQFENYNPVIGMNRRHNQAHLGAPGHRMVDRSVHRDRDYGRNNYNQQGNRYQNKRPYDNNQGYSSGGGGGGRHGSYNDYGHNNRHQHGQQQYGQQQQQHYQSQSSNYSNNSYYQQSRNNQQQSQQQQPPSYNSNYQYNSDYNYQNRRNQQQQQQPPQANTNIPSYYTPDYVANQPQQDDNYNTNYRQQQNYNRYRN